MSGDDEGLLGYSPTELELGEERKRSLSSVIFKLCQEWDLNPESPDRSRSRSVTSRRGSLDLPKNGGKALRSRSCDLTADLDKIKTNLKLEESTSVESLRSNEPQLGTEPLSFEMEAAIGESNADSSLSGSDQQNTEPSNTNVDNISFDVDEKENSDIVEKEDTSESKFNENDRIGSQEDGISESLKETDSEENSEEKSIENKETEGNLSDDEILEKVLEVVPKEELGVDSSDGETATTRATRRTRTSTASNESSATSSEDSSGPRETRSRATREEDTPTASASTGSLRETRTRSRAVIEDPEPCRETRSRSSLPGSVQSCSLTEDEERSVRETRARSRAAAEENQPPARSTRSNRDSTPDNRKGTDKKKKLESGGGRLKRSVTNMVESEPKTRRQTDTHSDTSDNKRNVEVSERKSSELVDSKVSETIDRGDLSSSEKRNVEAPERRLLRRTQDDRSRGATPDCEVRLTRRSVAEILPEKRSTRSHGEIVEGIKPLKSPDIDHRTSTRESRKALDAHDVKADDTPGGRRTRSVRSDVGDSNKKHELVPSRSPPSKKFKTEEGKEKTEDQMSIKKETSKKDGIVITVKKKKKKFGEKGKAFLEADVIRRVQELKTQGLWTDKKLPKQYLEPKTKTHWDFVLEEMTWLSDVVQKELKIKKANAKKCAAMVQKYFKDKELASIRAEKMREANLRKIAANMAREVRVFWGNAQKLFEWRVKQKLERKRKEALDQHLQFIVDKTEKYSTLLAESLAETTSGQVSRAESVCSGDTEESPGDGEYAPESGSSDDEETIEKEETEAKDAVGAEEELADLEAAAEVPIEELLKKYYPDQLEKMKDDKEVKAEDIKKEDADIKKEDDENKEPIAESSTGRRRRKPINFAEVEKKIKEEDNNTLLGESVEEEVKVKSEQDDKKEKEDEKEDGDLKSLVESEDKLEEYANMAAKFQPTGNTLETTTVKTKVPSLLKHTLREYQHIGLDWLVSLYERGLNGILADEMGLGKTIQTIALMAHLAVDRGNWGPHLIVVPTSVMLNWEMEIKKWCPGFKVLVYYGSQKERRMKRVGWTKPNAFHICITSYKLVTQDHSSFRRFKWQYFILDEAQHIKNFKSQRWQLLLNFVSVGRLLLTGTPLQNNLMELWSLMHFLMPHVFESHRDFKEWFSNPLTGMVEGNSEYNDSLIRRLHKVLRPFLLRRLKSEVEKQLPKKYEHLVKCPLSKRQRYLYDDFMSRAKTKETLASGNLLSVINVLMQLRKCCNHPNLFEPRPTLSPFVMDMVDLRLPRLVYNCIDYKVDTEVDLRVTPLHLLHHELNVDPYTAFRASCLASSSSRMMNPPPESVLPKFPCPTDKIRVEIKSQNPPVPKQDFEHHSPVLPLTLTGLGYVIPARKLSNRDYWLWRDGHKLKTPSGYFQIAKMAYIDPAITSQIDNESDPCTWSPPKKVQKVDDKQLEPAAKKEDQKDPDSTEAQDEEPRRKLPRSGNKKTAKGIFSLNLFSSEKMVLAARSPNKAKKRRLEARAREAELISEEFNSRKESYMLNRRKRNYDLNKRRCEFMPIYGSDLVECVQQMSLVPFQLVRTRLEQLTCRTWHGSRHREEVTCFSDNLLVHTLDSSLKRIEPIFDRFVINVPNAWVSSKHEVRLSEDTCLDYPGDSLRTKFQVQTPDTRLIQYDCGKLQILSVLLRRLFTEGHRALIFTQMTRMLDVLEAFLNYHGYVYMRLDGATKVETRQALMERFNNNSKYFIFILSTRSGGVGINLTGADTVIFYDSDWNPTMDAQAQDRCHRIGQTRDVHIYRLVSERTVEENILKKANQKRILGDLAIEGGNFTTAFFKKQTIHDLFEENANATTDDLAVDEENTEAPKKSIGAFENALATAEDDTDRQATKDAKAEENVDEQDFTEQTEEDQFNAVLAELSKVEVYALKHVEWMEEDWVQGQMAAAEAEIEARKEEFDAEKMDELTQEIREEMGDVSSEGGEADEEDGDGDEGEYSPDESDTDDEETIEKDEKEVDDKNNDNEINMLENEAEVPIEELIKQYYPDQYKQMDLGHQQMETSAAAIIDTETTEEFKILDVVQSNDHDMSVNEEFHVEAVEHVTQELMEQVQDGFVAHVTETLPELPQQVLTNHSAGDGGENSQHLVNGGDNVHIDVLQHHELNSAQENDDEALQAFAQVLESYQSGSEQIPETRDGIVNIGDNDQMPNNGSVIHNSDAENENDNCKVESEQINVNNQNIDTSSGQESAQSEVHFMTENSDQNQVTMQSIDSYVNELSSNSEVHSNVTNDIPTTIAQEQASTENIVTSEASVTNSVQENCTESVQTDGGVAQQQDVENENSADKSDSSLNLELSES